MGTIACASVLLVLLVIPSSSKTVLSVSVKLLSFFCSPVDSIDRLDEEDEEECGGVGVEGEDGDGDEEVKATAGVLPAALVTCDRAVASAS